MYLDDLSLKFVVSLLDTYHPLNWEARASD